MKINEYPDELEIPATDTKVIGRVGLVTKEITLTQATVAAAARAGGIDTIIAAVQAEVDAEEVARATAVANEATARSSADAAVTALIPPLSSVANTGAGTAGGYVGPANLLAALSENDGTPNSLQIAVGAADNSSGKSVLLASVSGDGVTDAAVALNAALALGGHWVIPADSTVLCDSTITMSVAETRLEIFGKLKFSSAVTKGLNVTGANVTIDGSGIIESPATFDGTNARRTYAVVWVSADGFKGRGSIRLVNIPRAGVHFEDCIDWSVFGWSLDGNFPKATYTGSGSTLTGHAGFSYNPPPTGTTSDCNGEVSNNRVSGCVQGFLIGNFDSAASNCGVLINSNRFVRCHDHAIYHTLSINTVITGNTFLHCKTPLVIDGSGSVVTGNTSFSDDSSLSQNWSIRDASNTLMTGNTIVGYGAAIGVENLSGTSLTGNKINNNTVISTGAGNAAYGIRLGALSQTCSDNEIIGNHVSGANYGAFDAPIQLLMLSSSYTGQRNKVKGNVITNGSPNSALLLNYQNAGDFSDNTLICSGSAGSAVFNFMLYGVTITNSIVRGNRIEYKTGGTNVTCRAVQFDTSTGGGTCFEDNRLEITSASLTAAYYLDYLGAGIEARNNRLSPSAAMSGTSTIASGAATVVVTNANVIAASKIQVTPANGAAGVTAKTIGYFVTCTGGSFTLSTGDGTNTAAASDFFWQIV